MKTEMRTYTIKQLMKHREDGILAANPEYQRGEVWLPHQQKKLIDSVFREYRLPVFYLQHRQGGDEEFRQDRLDIIDGQQRLNALYYFWKGHFALYSVHNKNGKFPSFLQNEEKHPCPWGGKDFASLPSDLQSKFLDTELQVAFIKDAEDSEIRDLFIRLQSGSPLSAQEKRDAYPGEFTDFILKLGGKPALDKLGHSGYPGHPFFTTLLGMKKDVAARQLAAQIAVLFFARRKNGLHYFSHVRRQEIDEYYDTQLEFDSSSSDCQRLRSILDKVVGLLGQLKGKKMQRHNAIHLVLFVDSLLDDYTPSWESALKQAQEQFMELQAQANLAYKKRERNETWDEYGQFARTNADSKESIEQRHTYYTGRMAEFLGGNLVPKDSKRLFNDLERQVIYWRDKGKCRIPQCGAEVQWKDVHIHHIIEHQDGGRTVIDNGVLVHKGCHPQGAAAKEFAQSLGNHA